MNMNELVMFFNNLSIDKFIDFIKEFNAINTLINNDMIIMYLGFILFTIFYIRSYLGYIFSLNKSEVAIKVISKKYNIIQRFFCIHYNENIYKKVDRLYFNFIYKFHYVYLTIITLTLLSLWLSKYYDIFNIITCVLLIISTFNIVAITICFFVFTKGSPTGGVEFRSAAKYRRKKIWW